MSYLNKQETIMNRWWALYNNDLGCKKFFNGLHLLAALYGDDEEDSDTFMQSMTGNKHGQLFVLEFATEESQLKETLASCMWNEQYPEGFFAHLCSQLPKLQVMSGISQREQIFAKEGKRLETWEEWGKKVIHYDERLRNRSMYVCIDGKRLEGLLTEEQRTNLENRLI